MSKDQASSCQSYPRNTKKKEFLAALCGQKVGVENKQSEEEDDEPSNTHKPKSR